MTTWEEEMKMVRRARRSTRKFEIVLISIAFHFNINMLLLLSI